MSAPTHPKFRFAPSPNGLLHLGHAYSALVTNQLACAFEGEFRLRIEDIDKTRSRETYIEAIFRDLRWLGLSWPEPVRRQSDHFASYQSAQQLLKDEGLLYPCFASRKDIENAYKSSIKRPRDPDGALLYPGLYKKIDQGELKSALAENRPHALRLDMPKAIQLAEKIAGAPLTFKSFCRDGAVKTKKIDPTRWGDVIIARKDIPTSYHLSVVVDDQIEEITHVSRGKDLLASTDIHRLLQILLRYHEPLYFHHDIVTINYRDKLSKSKKHPSLHDLRGAGVHASEIVAKAEKGADALSNFLSSAIKRDAD